MRYIYRAVLSNAQHPEYGVATIPFPIPKEEYDHVLELLEPLEIGDPLQRDCSVDEIDSGFSILKRLKKVAVNLEEMDYLAKRLDSFDDGEAAQFQAAAVKMGLFDMKDLINLTFCCQGMTVISDFGKLEQAGKDHAMNLNGGCMPSREFDNLDGEAIALQLLQSSEGTVTPYGVVYDNGVKLEHFYDGVHFPSYAFEPALIGVEAMNLTDEGRTFLFLPMPDSGIERQLRRIGTTPTDAVFAISEQTLPPRIADIVERSDYSIADLNDMCYALYSLDGKEISNLNAVMDIAEPETPAQIARLARNLDLFDVVPDVRDYEDLGRYLIQESGHYEYDENLEDYYNYEACGREQALSEKGQFTEHGYIAYHGTLCLNDLMAADEPGQGFGMGGMA